jgi:hypothetical protein
MADDVMSFEIPPRLAARLVLLMDDANRKGRAPLTAGEVLTLCIAFALQECEGEPARIYDLAPEYLLRD